MKKILLLGAGRSSGSLIQYLLKNAESDHYILRVADLSVDAAQAKTGGHPNSETCAFNVEDDVQRTKEIEGVDLVISMLPAHLHILAAKDCLTFSKNLVTASYISAEIAALSEEAVQKNLLFLNECGLDPGIDHMSAMEVIHRLQKTGMTLTSFCSYTGGLIAPESNDNPWGYKFTWNPRNVILAGQGTARYIKNGHYHYTPYSRLFTQIENIAIDGHGSFDGYANRDSLSYRKHYGIEQIPTLIRGTLRQGGFCSAWQVFVTLGLTDDTYVVEDSEHLTYAALVEAFLPNSLKGHTLMERIARLCTIDPDGPAMQKIIYTGILSDKIIGLKRATPAQILQHLLEQKWVLQDSDKDMIVMQHIFEYNNGSSSSKLTSSLVVKGENSVHTAMAKTVGLPLGIAARLLLKGKIKATGVLLPVTAEIYQPILDELKTLGISFAENVN